jgi:hypothetical protein
MIAERYHIFVKIIWSPLKWRLARRSWKMFDFLRPSITRLQVGPLLYFRIDREPWRLNG